jgi:putative proteasome-type protease
MNLREGMVFVSDSRTNAGVDHIATFRKLHTFTVPGERVIVLQSAGNLATTQSVVSLLRARSHDPSGLHLLSAKSMYEAAEVVGATVREVIARDTGPQAQASIDFGCSFLVGGQIRGEDQRLFNIYPQGNFIESTPDTLFFQIGESKYGKPIIDRVLSYDTPLRPALQCALISFDSTIKSNLSVGMPLDRLVYVRDSFSDALQRRVDENDEYFRTIRKGWSEGLRRLFHELPAPPDL